MTNKSNKLSERIEIHGEAIRKSMRDISETARQAIADINAGFYEAQRMIDEMQRLADFAEGKPPKVDEQTYYGFVYGSEYLLRTADNKFKRSSTDENISNKNITQKVNDNGDVIITINIPK